MAKRKNTNRATKRAAKKTEHTVARCGRRRNYKAQTVIEDLGGRPYEYVTLGKYVVAARGVCGGRPTIKYHRLDARWILAFYNNGDSAAFLAKSYKIPVAAVKEVIGLADQYDYEARYI